MHVYITQTFALNTLPFNKYEFICANIDAVFVCAHKCAFSNVYLDTKEELFLIYACDRLKGTSMDIIMPILLVQCVREMDMRACVDLTTLYVFLPVDCIYLAYILQYLVYIESDYTCGIAIYGSLVAETTTRNAQWSFFSQYFLFFVLSPRCKVYEVHGCANTMSLQWLCL